MSRIFIVEDDATHRNELVKLLSRYGYTGIVSDDFENIVLEVLSTAPDLIILDINLPYFDGFHICREIRKQSSVPIIILTSRSGEMDEIMGLEIGADDFIAKPFNPGVVIAHIAAVLKRSKGMTEDDLITCRGLKLDIAKSFVSYGERSVELTRNERQILMLLMRNSEKIVSREKLMDTLWQSDEFVSDNTLTMNINRLRKKLDEIGAKEFVQTKRGMGYLL